MNNVDDSSLDEVSEPAPQPKASKWVTTAEAAKLMGVSFVTFKRAAEKSHLSPRTQGLKRLYLREKIYELMTKRGINPPERGAPPPEFSPELTAKEVRVVELISSGVNPAQVVSILGVPPSFVTRVLEDTKRMFSAAAPFLKAVETSKEPQGPVFDHPPKKDGSCCPGHAALMRMQVKK